MDALTDKLITSGPLGVLVVVVVIFVWAQSKTAEVNRAWLEQLLRNNQLWIERMHQDHLLARTESKEFLTRNTTSMDRNTTAMSELTKAVSALISRQA